MPTTSSLPDELTLRILRFLPHRHLLRIRRLNRTRYSLIWDPSLFRALFVGLGYDKMVDEGVPGVNLTRWSDELNSPDLRGIPMPALESVLKNVASVASTQSMVGIRSFGVSPEELERLDSDHEGPTTLATVFGSHGHWLRDLDITGETSTVNPINLDRAFSGLVFPNLRSVDFRLALLDHSTNAFFALLRGAPQLEAVTLYFDMMLGELVENNSLDRFLFPGCPRHANLKDFKLFGHVVDATAEMRYIRCQLIDPAQITNLFPKLEALSVRMPWDFQTTDETTGSFAIEKTAQKLPRNLKYLQIWSANQDVTAAMFKKLGRFFPHLERLAIVIEISAPEQDYTAAIEKIGKGMRDFYLERAKAKASGKLATIKKDGVEVQCASRTIFDPRGGIIHMNSPESMKVHGLDA